MAADVDLVVFTRHDGPLDPEVERAFRTQRDVRLVIHRVVGSKHPDDRSRMDAIARARNKGKSLGAASWVMFLDDDVVLEPTCISRLLGELRRRPAFAALAADYLGEGRPGAIACHVSMGATLFRREALERVNFTWSDGRCECQCCCDDLRRDRWGIDYCANALARHLPKIGAEASPLRADSLEPNPIVTCMCVTRNRSRLLRRSIQCFLQQTYSHRELIVVYESDDAATRELFASFSEPLIRPVEVPSVPRRTLGALRNIAVREGVGKYVAQWDDDDWYSPDRLAEQMNAIRDTGKRGCVLWRWTVYDCRAERAYISGARPWEGSMVAERSILPMYPDLPKQEDTPVVENLVRQGLVTLLDRPDLYIYAYHGMNTWDRSHWDQIIGSSTPLRAELSGLVTSLLRTETRDSGRLQTYLANSIRQWQFFCREAAPRRRRQILA